MVGYPEKAEDVYNTAAVLADGGVVAIYRKMYLPNYGVFDEQRYFQSGAEAAIFELNGVPIGLSICEDIWEPGPPAMTEALAGAQVIVNLSASPYRRGVGAAARAHADPARGGQPHRRRLREHRGRPGRARLRRPQPRHRPGRRRSWPGRRSSRRRSRFCTIDPRAVTAARLRDTRHRANVRRQRRAGHAAEPPVFTLASIQTESQDGAEVVSGELAEVARPGGGGLRRAAHRPARLRGEERLRARGDRAVGRDRLRAGRAGGRRRARPGAGDVRVDALPLLERGHEERRPGDRREPRRRLPRDRASRRPWRSYDEMLREAFDGSEPDVTEENVQARIRGNVVMALSNKFGWLVLATGNKSEMSVGYATLYGDMAGGFAVLKDVYKDLGLPAGALAQRAGGQRAGAGIGARAPALGGAAPRAARRRVATALRRARPDPRGLHRGGPRRRGAGAPRPARRGGGARDPHGRPGRVQAPPGSARDQDLRPAPSAATGGCRSRTATRDEPSLAGLGSERCVGHRAEPPAARRRVRAPPARRAGARRAAPAPS